MNFQQYYNRIINEQHSYDIPAMSGGDEVWGWASSWPANISDEILVRHYNDQEIHFVKNWKMNYTLQDEDTGEMQEMDNFEFTYNTLSDLKDAVTNFNNARSPEYFTRRELPRVINEFERRVDPQYRGEYKFFGNWDHEDFWICFCIKQEDMLNYKLSRVNNALTSIKDNDSVNKMFKKKNEI